MVASNVLPNFGLAFRIVSANWALEPSINYFYNVVIPITELVGFKLFPFKAIPNGRFTFSYNRNDINRK